MEKWIKDGKVICPKCGSDDVILVDKQALDYFYSVCVSDDGEIEQQECIEGGDSYQLDCYLLCNQCHNEGRDLD